MTKRKMLLCAAVLAVAGAVVLFNKPPVVKTDAVQDVSKVPEAGAASASVSAAVASANPAVSTTNQIPTVRGTLPYVLTSKVPFDKPLRLVAEAMGAKTVGIVSRNALLVEADAAARARLSADSRFEGISEFLPSDKIQPELAALIAGGAESVDVAIISLAAEDRQIVMSCLAQGGGEMLKGCLNEGDTIRAKLPADLVSTLAQRGDVRWMERFVRPELTNNNAVKPETMDVIPVWDVHEITGDGQVVSTSDSGIDTGDPATLHEDLRDRVLDMKTAPDCDAFDSNGHGTHTAGSIVGTGAMSSGLYRGTAWGAHLYAWFCGRNGGRSVYTPATCAELFRGNEAGDEWPAFIHSASWGSNTKGAYTGYCPDFDKYVWAHPDFLPVVSAGNTGPGKRTVGSPAAAKNVLAVGATMNLPYDPAITASFSSRGPCQDGRIKPDISAPGCYVTSTKSSLTAGTDEYYARMQGTSMSCPLTAGSVALVRQWLVEKMGYDNPDEPPTAALMKAVIMGGAKGAAVPNQDQGWGRVDLEETLFPSNRAVKLVDRIPFAAGFVTNIVVETTNAAPLDVQLVWVDYHGSRLVNDIDLTVEARVPGEPTVRYGNGGDEPDAVNNAEVVRIADAQPTKYVITVDCKTILHDYNEGGAAALYIRGAFDPEATPTVPEYVRIKERGLPFMRLDKALQEVQDGETVEVLDWVGLDKTVQVGGSCTIYATNVNPVASRVIPCKDAKIVVADGVNVTVSNIVFDVKDGVKTFAVENGGVLKVGTAAAIEAVETVNAGNLVVISELTQPFYVDCQDAPSAGGVFALSDVPLARVEGCANVMLHYTNTRLGGEAFDDAGSVKFRWSRGAPVPLAKTVAQIDMGAGLVNYRVLTDLFEDYAIAGDVDAEIVVRKSTPYDQYLAKACDIVIRGEYEDGGEKPVLGLSEKSGFRLEDGSSLTISNVVMRGHVDPDNTDDHGFIYVDGGELTLDDGAVLDGLVGHVYRGSGVVDILAGEVTMAPGAAIVNCRAEGGYSAYEDKNTGGFGGAVYAIGQGCVLNLDGCVVSNCFATGYGGAVFVDEWNDPAEVNLSGALRMAGNASGNGPCDDLCFFKSSEMPGFRLVGEAQGVVGVWYETNEKGLPTGNAVGDAFMTNAVGVVDKATLACFFNDTDPTLVAVTNANGLLVWAEEVGKGTCGEADASAHVWYEGASEALHYENVATAFAFLPANTNATVELYKDGETGETFRSNIVVPDGTKVTMKVGDGKTYGLLRNRGAGFTVPAGTSLTLTNVVIGRGEEVGTVTNALFDVDGGSLTLASGACISKILGNSSRDAGAVVVHGGGTVTMLPGSKITGCESIYNNKIEIEDKGKDYGCGGGLLVDDGKAYLRGGEISNCIAVRGGGVYVCNDAEVYVSGGMRISGNMWQNTNGVRQAGNVFVADLATLHLDGELTGRIGVDAGLRLVTDTNLVAKVVDGWTVGALTNSAPRFVGDATEDVGVAVTNGTKALVVWSAAARGGVYTNAEDKLEYGVVDWKPLETPVPPPAPRFTVVTNTPAALAFVSIVPAADAAGCKLTLADLVTGVRYAVFSTNTLEGGFNVDGVEPVTNFTAESDGPCELVLPDNPAHLFWRATATETYKTNYLDKVD